MCQRYQESAVEFGRNLTIRHLISYFNTYDEPTKAVSFETLFEFTLSLTWTKYQNRFCIVNRSSYRVIANAASPRQWSIIEVSL